MNACVECLFETGSYQTGNYMVGGTSLCQRHASMQKPVTEVPSDASEPKVKWKDDTVAK